MRCPKCYAALAEKTVEDYTVRGCLGCGGLWIDKDLLPTLGEKLAWQLPPDDSEKELLFHRTDVAYPHPGASAVCPGCGRDMQEFNFAYDSNIMLDRCPNCHGLWLDPGELMKIARHMQYDPDLDAVGRSILKSAGDSDDGEPNLIEMIAVVALILARIIFRF
ncbi:MAG: zf-TFIIB domain-containing protein [Phycisphaerae bacterium]|nr:zf-TFIIB domain-containing protein [Phycisphaerae bacterium]